jgi:hypothetical protein
VTVKVKKKVGCGTRPLLSRSREKALGGTSENENILRY